MKKLCLKQNKLIQHLLLMDLNWSTLLKTNSSKLLTKLSNNYERNFFTDLKRKEINYNKIIKEAAFEEIIFGEKSFEKITLEEQEIFDVK